MKQPRPYYLNRTLAQIIATAFVMVYLLSCTSTNKKLVIATAANAQFAMQEIANSFSKETGIGTELVISSSGKHTAQILAGAPYDLFISADMKYPEKLYQETSTTKAPEIYAYGQLVLWSMDPAMLQPVNNLGNFEGKHIAMPNPATAPYGIAARQVLDKLELWSALQDKFVFGESVAQTNQYIISGAAATGFTASSIVMAPANKNKGTWTAVPDSLYLPIAQGVVILSKSENLSEAEKFYEYLFSPKAQEILKSFGYRTKLDK